MAQRQRRFGSLGLAQSATQFQRDVPFVCTSVELVCNWFDGHYLPDEPNFVALFSQSEWRAVTKFSALFAAVTSSFDQSNCTEIEKLLQTPDWLEVVATARMALAAFNENRCPAKTFACRILIKVGAV